MKTIPSLLLCLLASMPGTVGSGAETDDLWPGTVPGEKAPLTEERDMTKPTDRTVAGKPVLRLGNVSEPTITVFRPTGAKNAGTAVLVCPGGGYNIVAMDLEGTEICDWLNSLGITGVLLKYRVPKREGLEKHAAPLQDAQRAFGLVRQRASELGIATNRIGVIGFSAGGHLAAMLSTSERRTYPRVDSADDVSCRPDFALLIYPAYLTEKEHLERISPELKVTANHPPTFLAMAQDDPVHVESAVYYYLALHQAKVPSELHVYPAGGHGYGLRRTDQIVTTWPARAADWLRSQGLVAR